MSRRRQEADCSREKHAVRDRGNEEEEELEMVEEESREQHRQWGGRTMLPEVS